MEKEQLKNVLSTLNSNAEQIEIILYGKLKDETLRTLDVKAEDLVYIKDLFIEEIRNLLMINDDYSLHKLSTTDERANCYYEYDLDIPDDFAPLLEVFNTDNIENFNFKEGTLKDVSTLIIAIKCGEVYISLYKKISPLEIIGQKSALWGFNKDSERIERNTDNYLRISSKFQIICINETIIIIDLKFLEKNFGFKDIIKKEASIGLKAIESLNILTTLEPLNELLDNISFARKLTKISKDSPVLRNNIPNDRIIKFTQEHVGLKGRIRYNDDCSKISLDTKVSRDLFVKLLNDDFLTSELTELEYDSLAKDNISDEI